MPKINRPHSIVVKVTADERDAITRLALKEKLTAANWLRSLGMNVVTAPAPSFKELTSIIETPPSTPESPLNDVPEPPNPSLPENGSIAHRFHDAPKPPTAEQRIYDVVLKNKGKAVADAWLRERQKLKGESVVVIGEPDVPAHLKPFYQNLIKQRGQAEADFWLLTNTKGVKLAP